jgi:hypothetical protein
MTDIIKQNEDLKLNHFHNKMQWLIAYNGENHYTQEAKIFLSYGHTSLAKESLEKSISCHEIMVEIIETDKKNKIHNDNWLFKESE